MEKRTEPGRIKKRGRDLTKKDVQDMADAREITIPVQLDAGTFRRFACFDTLIRKKRGILPVVFLLYAATHGKMRTGWFWFSAAVKPVRNGLPERKRMI